MVRLWSSRHAGKLLRSFLFTVCTSLNFTRFMTLDSPSSVFAFYLSDIFFFPLIVAQLHACVLCISLPDGLAIVPTQGFYFAFSIFCCFCF